MECLRDRSRFGVADVARGCIVGRTTQNPLPSVSVRFGGMVKGVFTGAPGVQGVIVKLGTRHSVVHIVTTGGN